MPPLMCVSKCTDNMDANLAETVVAKIRKPFDFPQFAPLFFTLTSFSLLSSSQNPNKDRNKEQKTSQCWTWCVRCILTTLQSAREFLAKALNFLIFCCEIRARPKPSFAALLLLEGPQQDFSARRACSHRKHWEKERQSRASWSCPRMTLHQQRRSIKVPAHHGWFHQSTRATLAQVWQESPALRPSTSSSRCQQDQEADRC